MPVTGHEKINENASKSRRAQKRRAKKSVVPTPQESRPVKIFPRKTIKELGTPRLLGYPELSKKRRYFM